MDQVRLAIIGYGGIAGLHRNYLLDGKSVPNARLVAVADPDPARLEAAARELPEDVKKYASADALFAAGGVDAVLICTPHYFHPPLAIQAFQHGCHVLTEKPAGVYTRQVREMNEAAEKSGKIFGIMFQMRTDSLYQKLKDLIDSGELGEIRRTNWLITTWFRSQAYYDSGGWRATWAGEGGGVLLNQCPHNLDIWQWTCGLPKRVRAHLHFGKYHNIEVEDDVTAYVEYENGATGLFITTTGEHPGTNRFEVDGDNGKVVIEDRKLTFSRTRQGVQSFLETSKSGFGGPETWECEVPIRGDAGGHAQITKQFIDAIQTGGQLIAPGQDGIRGLSLSNAMMLSAWTDSWVDLPIDEDRYYDELQKRIAESTFKKTGAGAEMDLSKSFNG